jgi:hypothetical protein
MKNKMKYNLRPLLLKYLRSSIILVLLLFNAIDAFSQQQDFTLEIEVENASDFNSNDGSILVKTNISTTDNLFVLYDKMPYVLADYIDKSERIVAQEYLFVNLKPGNYFVCVWDSENNMVCDKVKIDHK